MYRRLALLNTLILVAAIILCVAFTSHSQPASGIGAASVNIITSATKTNDEADVPGKATPPGPGTRTGDDDYTQYYYLVTKSDGSMDYEVFSRQGEQDRRDALRDEYKTEANKYNELRKQWMAAFGNKPFSVDRPKAPSLKQKGKLPTSDKYRSKAEDRNDAELEQYVVCVLTNQEGARTAEVIRKDKVAARKNDLNKQFVQAALAEAAARKSDPEAAKGPFTLKRPELQPVGAVMPKEAAEKNAAKVQEKLDAKAESQTPEQSQPDGTPSEQ